MGNFKVELSSLNYVCAFGLLEVEHLLAILLTELKIVNRKMNPPREGGVEKIGKIYKSTVG